MVILKYGDKILKQKGSNIAEVNDNILQLIKDMKECLKNTPGGIGLAAPQIGVSIQLFIIDLSILDEFSDKDNFIVINPVIIDKKGIIKESEGCLSFPGITTIIKRYQKITVKYRDENWEEKIIQVDGFLSRAFQHEIDHLNGILIIDRVSSVKKQIIKRDINKLKITDEW